MRYLAALGIIAAFFAVGVPFLLLVFAPVFIWHEWGLISPLGVMLVLLVYVVGSDL